MSGAIGPGDFVEYIGPSGFGCGPWQHLGPALGVGSAYRVFDVIPGYLFPDGRDALELSEFPGTYPNGERFCWDIACFRPIYRPKSELLESLLRKADEPIREDA